MTEELEEPRRKGKLSRRFSLWHKPFRNEQPKRKWIQPSHLLKEDDAFPLPRRRDAPR